MIVEQLPKFKNDVKYYVRKKKYLTVPKLVRELTEQLEAGELPGVKIADVELPTGGAAFYKVRLPNPDANAGKSNGFRVIYYLTVGDEVFLLTVYSKKDDGRIPEKSDLLDLVDDFLTRRTV